jgi:hypothetical protein
VNVVDPAREVTMTIEATTPLWMHQQVTAEERDSWSEELDLREI